METADAWVFPITTPVFEGRVTGIGTALAVEIEHDPSAAGQGSGLIWSGTGSPTSGESSYSALTVPTGKLQDGWSIRIRARAATTGTSPVTGQWSEWQAAKVSTHKPVVETWYGYPTMETVGDWVFPVTTPTFEGRINDPGGRTATMTIEIEHHPSAAGQGSGLIWSGAGSPTSGESSYSALTVPTGKLQDGWSIRIRARAVTTGSSPVAGPWSEWQAARMDTHKPLVDTWYGYPTTRESDLWTFPITTPTFEGRINDPGGRTATMTIEIEHDPSAAGQGSGLIWSGAGSPTSGESSYSALTVPTGKLQDGWSIRIRARAVTTGSSPVAGPWSAWRAAKIDTHKPIVDNWYGYPTSRESGLWTFPISTPTFEGRITDPGGRAASLVLEIQHDPSVPGQGSGLIWSGTGSPTSGESSYSALTVPTGKLQDGWLVRMRVRATTTGSTPVSGPWTGWHTGRIDTHKPIVDNWYGYPASEGIDLWTFNSLIPTFEGRITDSGGRPCAMTVEIEHEPSVPAQGSGLIWSGAGSATSGESSYSAVTVPANKLRDGWLIRIRVRAATTGSAPVAGPWSEWQTARIGTDKPIVDTWYGYPAAETAAVTSFSTLTPTFEGRLTGASSRINVEIEHDPSAADQGSGLIWSGTGSPTSGESSYSAVNVPTGKLQNGWVVRMRARASNATGVGPWTTWTPGMVEVGKPAGTGLGAMPATRTIDAWALSSTTPQFYMKVTDPGGAQSVLAAEIEHDPGTPGQGIGRIWTGKDTTPYASGSNAWISVPAGKLGDGWKIRWRVRGVNTAGTAGAWSAWQLATIDLKKPSADALGMTPATESTNRWTLTSLTPWLYAKATDPESRASFLGVELQHDPAAPAQGSGLIYSGKGLTAAESGAGAWLQVPAGKLIDGWLIRWRVRAETTTSVVGPWSEWKSAKIDLNKPAVEAPGMAPAIRGSASWTAVSLTPSLYAKVVDTENRASRLGVEIEHDPGTPEQGAGTIYAGTSTETFASGAKAWLEVPAGKLSDGWLIRWRVRAITTSGATGPWAAWQTAKVSALPFETFSPAHNTQVGTLTPALSAHARPYNEALVTYWFQVCAGKQPTWTWCESSAEWEKAGTWQVPEGKLKWGQTYWWSAKATSGGTTVTSAWRSFTPTPEQGTLNAHFGSGSDGRDFDHSSGNYARTETDASVAVTGPPLSVTRTYNSLDPRAGGAFGSGWTTRWDMRIEPEPQTSTLLLTYPGGEQLRFAAKHGGTPRTPDEAVYASPSGTFATLAKLPEGGWRLMDKSATSYWFDATGRLTKVTDHRNRSQDLTYGADGKLAKVTATGGRSLTFTWSGAHVASVSTDPVNGAPLTWTYLYDGDKLIKACPPGTITACTTYTYSDASRYRSAVLDSAPEGYWRLGESTTAHGTKLVNAAGWNSFAEEAKLTGTTPDLVAAVPGALTGSSDTAMRFKGTASSTFVTLPETAISGQGGNLAVEAWFKTTGSGTIIGYQNSAASTPSAFTPGIYVGTDGKLRGQFYTDKSAPITSTARVNDGVWHHVILSGAEDNQTLYLDGQQVGTLAGEISHAGQWETRIGSGFGSSAWPATTGSTAAFSFAGEIDEVAVYGKPLGAHVAKTHYAARSAQPQLTKAVAPTGRTEAENVYAADGGRLATQTDANGGIWKLSTPAYTKETNLLTFTTTTITDPRGGTTTHVDDAQRGGRPISQTDQLGKTTRFTYDTGGFPAKIFDANGNVTEVAYNSRGNLLSKKVCRTADTCFTEHFSYYLKIDEPFDPRNDLKIAHRDARSSSPVDDTYLTRWTFNGFGEATKETTPATPDFPAGRTWEKTYTDGTEPAAGGGPTPAGLLRTSKDFNGNTTTYTYTSAGDTATETTPLGMVKKYGHDALGRVVTQTDVSAAYPDGLPTTVTYDAEGRVTSRTSAGAKNEVTGVIHTPKASTTYDADGRPLTETKEDLTGGDAARTVTYTYDAHGRVETITGPEGGVQRYTHDASGLKSSFTDERGATFAYAYTARNEPATTTLKGWTGSPVDPQPATDVVTASFAYDPVGRLAQETDAMGRTTAFTYYGDNLPAEAIAKGARLNGPATPRDVVLESKVYDAAGNLIRQSSGGGTLTVESAYDPARRVTTQTVDPGGLKRVSAFSYDANGNVTKAGLTAAGTGRTEVTEYAYNAADQPVRQTVRNDGADLVTALTVDDRGLTTAMTDPRGNTTDISYDALGLPTQMRLPAVTVERVGGATTQRPATKLGYNSFGERTHMVDAEGRATTYTMDRAGRVTEQALPAYTAPGGQPVTPKVTGRYDAAGRLTASVDARGQTTTAAYDVLGNKVHVTTPKGGAWTYGYDLLGEVLSQTDPTGARSESTYDDLGRQITLTTIERKPAQAAYVTRMEYDDADRVIKTTRPTGDASTRAYDATGALTASTDALGNTTTFGYDLAGRTVATTDPLGLTSTAAYDLAGRKTQTQEFDADGALLRTKKFGYDQAGNPTSATSAKGHMVTRTFDAANRMVEQQEPVSATEKITTTFGYDASGAPTRSTDGRGNATYTTYNSLGLVESVIEPSTAAHPGLADRTWTTGYDASGNPVTSLIPGGVRIDRTFDELSRLIKETGTGAEAATEEKNFTYDLAGRLTAANDLSFVLDDRSQLLKTTGAAGDISAYAYDANKRLVQRADATGTASFTWDAADRLTRSVDPVSATTIDYGYDKAGRLSSMTYGAGGAHRSYAYDSLNRLVRDQLTTSSGGAIASIEYGYDLDDNMTSKTTAGTAGAGGNTYTYDWSNRLTSWTAPDGARTDYAWDASGNRVKAGDKTFTYDERNRLTAGDGRTYAYTARGTLREEGGGAVRMLRSDAFDRLVEDDGVSYNYDALDRVETRTQGQQKETMAYDGLTNNLITVTDAAGAVKAKFGRDALGRTLGISDGAGAQLAFCDLRGDLVGAFTADATALADSTAYGPFGEVTTRTGATHALGYQGGYTDPSSGKVNMAARWYQPSTGSFISRDTLTQNADPSVQLNRYTYANDNPLTNTDPDGHKAKKTTPKTSKTSKIPNHLGNCKAAKSKSKSCNAGYDYYDDCVDGYGSSKGCKNGTNKYMDCKKKGGKSLTCETQGVNTACTSRGGDKGYCNDANNVYKDCRAAGTSYTHSDRSVCFEGNQQYMDCRVPYSKKVCAEGTLVYEKCRFVQRGREQCDMVQDVYSTCRAKDASSVGGAKGYNHGFSTCQGVAAHVQGCLSEDVPSQTCKGIGMLQLDCLKVTKKDTIGCGQLTADVIQCFKKAGAECAEAPKKNCKDYSGLGGSYTECTWKYSPTQAWMVKSILDNLDVSAACSLAGLSGPLLTDVLTGACNLFNLGGKSNVETINKKWRDVVQANPGKTIIVTQSLSVGAVSGGAGAPIITIEPAK